MQTESDADQWQPWMHMVVGGSLKKFSMPRYRTCTCQSSKWGLRCVPTTHSSHKNDKNDSWIEGQIRTICVASTRRATRVSLQVSPKHPVLTRFSCHQSIFLFHDIRPKQASTKRISSLSAAAKVLPYLLETFFSRQGHAEPPPVPI